MDKYLIIFLMPFFLIGQNFDNNQSNTLNKSTMYYHEGRLIKEINKNNLTVTSSLRQIQRNDGKYYTFDISVINNTNRQVTLITKGISSEIFSKKGNKSIIVPALSRKDYLKIKKRRQNLRTGLMAFGAGMSAASAGYSSSTTTTNANAYYSGTSNTNSTANAYAYGSGGYGYANATGSSTTNYSGNIYGTATSTTQSYDGAAAYAASQNEAAKINAFLQSSEAAKKRWNNDYLKNHTLLPQETTSGLINIKYYKSPRIILTIPVDGELYVFEWSPDESEF
tara:strand:- start:145 stop:987 length:843 start_codon:yes stop_codon:yes gene_type:complete